MDIPLNTMLGINEDHMYPDVEFEEFQSIMDADVEDEDIRADLVTEFYVTLENLKALLSAKPAKFGKEVYYDIIIC